MIVVGLDLSLTSAGVSEFHTGRLRSLRSVGRRGRDSATYDERSDRVVAQTGLVLSLVPRNADLVMVEGPSYESHAGGGEFDRDGLWHMVYAYLRQRGTPMAVMAPSTLKKWATGDGHASKTQVKDAAREAFPGIPIRNSDEADALWCGAGGVHHLGDPLPFDVDTDREKALRPVKWGRRK